jgi:hypothetical protein
MAFAASRLNLRMTPSTTPQPDLPPDNAQVNPTGSRHPGGGASAYIYRRPSVFANWFWFIFKNVVGWLLILTAMVMGPLVPGPGGLPLFIIGFGLITFPGKRRITARVLSGAPIDPNGKAYKRGVAVVSLVLPAAALVYLAYERLLPYRDSPNAAWVYGGVYVVTASLMWAFGHHSGGLVNWLLRLVPRIRRRIRPWLRRKGIDLLPPRRRRRRIARGGPITRDPDEEILAIDERHQDRLHSLWAASKPWIKRVVGLVITAAIFFWMLKPVRANWDEVKHRVLVMSWSRFALAAAMFSVFLFVFRATTWRWLLIGMGERLPAAAAARIWSLSELARYLPGAIWQVLGRIYMVKQYGVRGSVCTASQLLELTLFLFANLLLALTCLVWFGIKQFHGPAAKWLYVAMAMVPVLLVVLHPKVLYGIIDRAMRAMKKPPVQRRLRFRELLGVLLWYVLGLLWQSVAIWLLVEEPLNLQRTKWWVVAGAYALAWCAGFLAVWAPGGIGVRELVFMAAMHVALPPAVKRQFESDPAALTGFLAFLSVLLRLWATSGELVFAGVTYLADLKGASAPASSLEPAKPLMGATVQEMD